MQSNALRVLPLVGLLLAGAASAAQVTLQQGLNGYTGYTHAEIKGYSANENATTLWELKMGNCTT
jgi:hypothetical protein